MTKPELQVIIDAIKDAPGSPMLRAALIELCQFIDRELSQLDAARRRRRPSWRI
jgi:hypothetical protein